MARRVRDMAIRFEAIVGGDPNDPTSLPDPAPRIGMKSTTVFADGAFGFDLQYAVVGATPEQVSAVPVGCSDATQLGGEIIDVPTFRFPIRSEVRRAGKVLTQKGLLSLIKPISPRIHPSFAYFRGTAYRWLCRWWVRG